MLARTKPFAKIATLLYYNEQKLREKKAECIYAGNFLKDADQLTQQDKTRRFQDLLQLNQRATQTALHVVLMFPPEERLGNQQLADIAASYMQRIGFGAQPYLVYRHLDAAVTHLHIASITIRPDGSHIYYPLLMPGRISEPARKAVEEEFGLIQAIGHSLQQLNPGPPQRIEYGRLPSKQVISHTLGYILTNFRYRSVTELNAILRQYNLIAKTGKPGSRLHSYHGLLYQILDEKGQGKGAPIKASALESKPTLRWLETKFIQHENPAAALIVNTRAALDAALRETARNKYSFSDSLRRNQLVLTPGGTVDGFLLVNFAEKAVIRATELGPGYDLASLRQKLGIDPLQPTLTPANSKQLRQKRQQKGHHI
jgi:hypothetical protein